MTGVFPQSRPNHEVKHVCKGLGLPSLWTQTPLVMSIAFVQHAQANLTEQSVFIAKAAIDGPRGQARPGSNARDGRPVEPFLVQNFGGGSEQPCERFAAALL